MAPPHPPPTHRNTQTHKHTSRQHQNHLSGSHCSLELKAGPQLNHDDGGARLKAHTQTALRCGGPRVGSHKSLQRFHSHFDTGNAALFCDLPPFHGQNTHPTAGGWEIAPQDHTEAGGSTWSFLSGTGTLLLLIQARWWCQDAAARPLPHRGEKTPGP